MSMSTFIFLHESIYIFTYWYKNYCVDTSIHIILTWNQTYECAQDKGSTNCKNTVVKAGYLVKWVKNGTERQIFEIVKPNVNILKQLQQNKLNTISFFVIYLLCSV